MTPEDALVTIQNRDYHEAMHGYFSIPATVIMDALKRERETSSELIYMLKQMGIHYER